MDIDTLHSFVRTTWGIDGAFNGTRNKVHFFGDYALKLGNAVALQKSVCTTLMLLQEGIQVAEPLPSLHGDYVVSQNETGHMLSRRLAGEHIDPFSQHGALYVEDIGSQTARLHNALLHIEQKLELPVSSLGEELHGWIPAALSLHGWNYIAQDEYQAAIQDLAEWYRQLPMQPIHRDVHCGNMLYNQAHFSGFIDFDLAKRDVRLFDCAYFLAGLLANAAYPFPFTQQFSAQWLELCFAFVKGYQHISPFSLAEQEALPHLMACIELLFVASSLRNNQDELAQVAANLYRFYKAQRQALQDIVYRTAKI